MKKYIVYDHLGRPANGKFPPDFEKNGGTYHGYKNDKEESLFYDFAVQGYDLGFSCEGKRYWFLSEEDYVALCDENFTNEISQFADGNAVLENFLIDGIPLIKLIDKLEDVEVY